MCARTAYALLAWRRDWFVATDKRLLLFYGLLTRRVAMMPLSKVTDMSYSRSLPGRLLGFGRFVMESAGHDQALREVNWVPRPDEHYRAICAEIFAAEERPRPRPEGGGESAPMAPVIRYAGLGDADTGPLPLRGGQERLGE